MGTCTNEAFREIYEYFTKDSLQYESGYFPAICITWKLIDKISC